MNKKPFKQYNIIQCNTYNKYTIEFIYPCNYLFNPEINYLYFIQNLYQKFTAFYFIRLEKYYSVHLTAQVKNKYWSFYS